MMLTGRPFHGLLVETNATNVVAPLELKAAVVCDVKSLPLMYPMLLTTAGPCTVMRTGGHGHAGWLDTNATSVVEPVELNAADVCLVNDVPLM
jgi:hypothetical protein